MDDFYQDLDKEVRIRAEKYFNQDYNCAQAVVLSNLELLNGQTDGIRQLAAGFGHGMNAGCTCGALAGGVMAIGLLLAGPETKGFDKEISEAAAELHRKFVNEFGLTCCRGLRKKLSPFKNTRCKEITVTTAAITLELLLARKTLSAPVGVHPF
ncbi:C-GCAxxG-C-C family protein [Pelotomaculum isophthalicicum JI]|uniref:C-GCAxxG-C-C family protein n=1 Tax=Pelotomaculum isophthalicicum JI TaxID=947010 RepID=A0A9X4H1K1_9FIRM|nr:C-GCAxxG-C-C family protein [Pelotomaculum isophthalicicum]MDF9407651.1 C-GCAxxG-C-C family protein [Pelotomaculum isophthalicicum JI]